MANPANEVVMSELLDGKDVERIPRQQTTESVSALAAFIQNHEDECAEKVDGFAQAVTALAPKIYKYHGQKRFEKRLACFRVLLLDTHDLLNDTRGASANLINWVTLVASVRGALEVITKKVEADLEPSKSSLAIQADRQFFGHYRYAKREWEEDGQELLKVDPDTLITQMAAFADGWDTLSSRFKEEAGKWEKLGAEFSSAAAAWSDVAAKAAVLAGTLSIVAGVSCIVVLTAPVVGAMVAGAGSLVAIASAIYWGSRVFKRAALKAQVVAEGEAASFKDGADTAQGMTVYIRRLVSEATTLSRGARAVHRCGKVAQTSWEKSTVAAWLEEHKRADQIETFLETEAPDGGRGVYSIAQLQSDQETFLRLQGQLFDFDLKIAGLTGTIQSAGTRCIGLPKGVLDQE